MRDPRNPGLQLCRRQFLTNAGLGFGSTALAGLLSGGYPTEARAHPHTPAVRPLPHFTGKAKRVIHLFMAGAPSQFELFDYKPELARLEGTSLPPSIIGDQRYAFIRPDAAVLGPRFKFAKNGKSGGELSSALPHLAEVVDDICILRAVHTDQFNHAPAQIFLSTGFAQPGRPSLGSWVLYGLGTETNQLPSYVVMSTAGGVTEGASLWSSGFMPTSLSGVQLRANGDPILNLSNPAGVDERLQADTYHLIESLNRHRLRETGDPEIATRIASFEMAAQLQVSAPNLTNLAEESAATLEMYGCDPKKPSFARACLLARRMVERGVRFVSIFHEGWDAHSDVEGNVRDNAEQTDKASAALIKDLKARGLLDETLVIWGGEFGRTPMVEANLALGRKLGRDHHPQAFSMWMAGGGIRPGITFGATDEFGFHPVESSVHIHDVLATALHCLGIDHEQLTFSRQGLDFRLTGVEPRQVIREILA